MFSAAILAGLFHLASADGITGIPAYVYVQMDGKFFYNTPNVGITLSDTTRTLYKIVYNNTSPGFVAAFTDFNTTAGGPYYLASDGSKATESNAPTLWRESSTAMTMPMPPHTAWLCDGPAGGCVCNSTYGVAPVQIRTNCNPSNVSFVYPCENLPSTDPFYPYCMSL